MKLTGYEAIAYAEATGLMLNKYNDPIEDAREGLTPGEARKIAAEDPNLIYVVVEATAENDACADCGSTGHNTGSNTCSGPPYEY